MKKFFSDFKEFITKGNIMDMAVGVVVGGAFGSIVNSLVNDIISPLIGLLTGGISLSDLKIVLSPAVMESGEIVTPENAILYGNFIQMIINFLIIALSIFIVLRLFMTLRTKLEALRKKEEEEAAEEEAEEPDPAERTNELLEQILAKLSEK